MGVTYDSGALIAAERGERRMWALHAGLIAEDVTPTVPAPVLAQTWRGGPRQAHLVRLLASCAIEELSSAQARSVGTLAGRADVHDIVDVTVVEGAIRRSDLVVTTDPDDLAHVAAAVNVELVVERP